MKSPMKHFVLVEVRHPAGDVSGEGQSAAEESINWIYAMWSFEKFILKCIYDSHVSQLRFIQR